MSTKPLSREENIISAILGGVVAVFGGPLRHPVYIYEEAGLDVTKEASAFDFAKAWTAIFMASIIGISFYLVVLLAERRLMPWHVSLRGE